jgi:hypothetical protein
LCAWYIFAKNVFHSIIVSVLNKLDEVTPILTLRDKLIAKLPWQLKNWEQQWANPRFNKTERNRD